MDVRPMIPTITSESTSYPQTPKINCSAFALITIGHGDARLYLLQWNTKWGVYNLIGGKVDNSRGDSSSFVRTIHRELEEEMGIKYPEDYTIKRELKPIYLSQYSQHQRCFKNYHFHVFDVDIFPNLPFGIDKNRNFARWLSTGRQNIFVTKEEILQSRTFQNRPVSRTTKLILQKLGELTPHDC